MVCDIPTTRAWKSLVARGKAIVHLCVWVGGILQVSFNGGAPVFSKYIDTFPFPFYIVLQDIASLPRTLADLLRQWFELTAAN